jgi:hypothetical protein
MKAALLVAVTLSAAVAAQPRTTARLDLDQWVARAMSTFDVPGRICS